MRGSGAFGQVLAGVVGALMVLSGLAAVSIDGSAGAAGAWLVVVGLVLIAAALLERRRYRSEAADRSGLPTDRAAASPSAPRSKAASSGPTRCSSTRRADDRCASGSMAVPASGGTAQRTETAAVDASQGSFVHRGVLSSPARSPRCDHLFEEAALH